MNKIIRIMLVLAFLIVLVALGMRGTAWASKLGSENQSPAANRLDQGLSAAARPKGTVHTGNPNVTLTVGQTVTVGSCATVELKSAPPDIKYTASTESKNNLSKYYPGNLISCLIKIHAIPADNKSLGAELQVCFPILPPETGFTYYWDGTQWVKTTPVVKEGYSCINVPTSAPNPLYTAMFDK